MSRFLLKNDTAYLDKGIEMKPNHIDTTMTHTKEETIKLNMLFKKAYAIALPKIKEIYPYYFSQNISKHEKIYALEQVKNLTILLVTLWLDLCYEQNPHLAPNKVLYYNLPSFLNTEEQEYIHIVASRFYFNAQGVRKVMDFLNNQLFTY